MNKNLIIGIVAIIVLLVAGYFILAMPSQVPVTENTNEEANQQLNENGVAGNEEPDNEVGLDVNVQVPKTHQIIYASSGYSPSTLTIKAGDIVRFMNNSSAGMWPASAMHPTHSVYGGATLQSHCPDAENDDFDACKSIAAGQSWSFTFKKTGAWGFHDHLSTGNFGKITVE
ncbi:MAG: hypothetical protein Q7S10_00145 [bacterium]|nr:hypothetical protein [bacterium]